MSPASTCPECGSTTGRLPQLVTVDMIERETGLPTTTIRRLFGRVECVSGAGTAHVVSRRSDIEAELLYPTGRRPWSWPKRVAFRLADRGGA